MTAPTLAETISAISNYTVGDSGDISTSELSTLQAMVAGDLARLNPGFSGNDLVLSEAYLVLDKFDNKPGTGFRTQEKIKDNSYTIRAPASSSYWMDCFLKMRSDFLMAAETGADYEGVSRDDADMTQYSDGSNDPYSDPYNL